jgi:hypothetical protein
MMESGARTAWRRFENAPLARNVTGRKQCRHAVTRVTDSNSGAGADRYVLHGVLSRSQVTGGWYVHHPIFSIYTVGKVTKANCTVYVFSKYAAFRPVCSGVLGW